MKNVIACFLTCLLCSCSTSNTVGNGKVDPVERAMIQLAVGMAFSAKPKTILPAYGVSTALLAVMEDGSKPVTLPVLELATAKEIEKLNLDPLTKRSFMDLVALIKAELVSLIGAGTVPASEKMVVVKTLIQIVHDSAEVRLSPP